MSQSHGIALAREPVGAGGTPTVTFGVITLVSPGVYTISLTGTPAASLLDDGAGGFMVSDVDLTGTGRIVVMGATKALLGAGPPPSPTWRSVGARVLSLAVRTVLAFPTEFKWAVEQPANTLGRSKIVPLTLTYGQQPHRIAPMPRALQVVARAAWPDEFKPPVQQPAETLGPSKIVPLTLTYGQRPPINGAITPLEMAQIRTAWPDTYYAPVKTLKGRALY